MAYKEGSMGFAIFIGMLSFFLLDVIFSLILTNGLSWSGIVGAGFAMLALGIVDGLLILLSIFIPILAGVMAGLVARGGAGRGFMAGFLSILMYSIISKA